MIVGRSDGWTSQWMKAGGMDQQYRSWIYHEKTYEYDWGRWWTYLQVGAGKHGCCWGEPCPSAIYCLLFSFFRFLFFVGLQSPLQ